MDHPSHVVSIKCPPNVDFGVVYVPEDEDDEGENNGESNAEEYDDEEAAEEDGFEYEEDEKGVDDSCGEAEWPAKSATDAPTKASTVRNTPRTNHFQVVGEWDEEEEDNEEDTAEFPLVHEGSGPEADHKTLAESSTAEEPPKSAKLTVANDSAVPVLLVAVHCLPRVQQPPSSESANKGTINIAAAAAASAAKVAGASASIQSLFQAELPPGGLMFNPGQQEDIKVTCVAPRFAGE